MGINLNVPKICTCMILLNQQYAVAATSSGIWLTIDVITLSQMKLAMKVSLPCGNQFGGLWC